MDYLLKPFTRRRFEESVRKVKQQLQLEKRIEPADRALALLEKLHQRNEYAQRVAVKSERGIAFLPCEQIEWIETKDNYVLIHSRKRSHLVRESMNGIERSLDPDLFLRIHRRILVNVDCIREFHPHLRPHLVLHDGSKLPVSRRMKESVKRFLLKKPV
jgi:two-component system LytT family response regulator